MVFAQLKCPAQEIVHHVSVSTVHSTHSLYYALAHRNNQMNGIWYDHEWLSIYTKGMYARCTYIRLCASVSTCHFWFRLFAVAAAQWKMVNWNCLVHYAENLVSLNTLANSMRIEGEGDFGNWHLKANKQIMQQTPHSFIQSTL